MAGSIPLAIVTGAASGVGLATARRLVRDDYRVAALDRDGEGLQRLAAELPGRIVPREIDLARLGTIEGAMQLLLRELGSPAVLVNNAGIALVATALDNDLDAWQRVIDVNLTAPMLLSRAVLPAMIEQGGGSIVNVASVAAFRGVRKRAAYCAAKAGLVGLTRSMTADFAHHGIRINAICPGTVETGYTQAVLAVADDPAATRQFMTQRQLIGRMGTPEEIANVALFLASPLASWVTGQTIAVAGGQGL